jgi:hypothetical protein
VDLVLDALERRFGQREELLADLGGEGLFVAAPLRPAVVVVFIFWRSTVSSVSSFVCFFPSSISTFNEASQPASHLKDGRK